MQYIWVEEGCVLLRDESHLDFGGRERDAMGRMRTRAALRVCVWFVVRDGFNSMMLSLRKEFLSCELVQNDTYLRQRMYDDIV